MDTKRYTPALVVEENLTFSIPLYQRLFAWGEEQVKGLLMDMKEHFSKHSSPYYLGMLSCITNNGHYDLIDGQQRFTVMTLMGIVFRDYHPKEETSAWEDFLAKGKRVNFIARSKDNDYLSAKISRDVSTSEINKKMEAAIVVIKSFMDDPDIFKNESERWEYANSVYNRLSFYFSSLPQNYLSDPTSLNKYFEAMNAHGKGLEQHEVLKVELMRDEPDKEHLTRVWNAVAEMGRPIIRRLSDDEPIEDYRRRYEYAIKCCRKGDFDAAFDCCSSSYDAIDNDTIDSIKAEKPKPASIATGQGELEERTIVSFPDFLLLLLDITLDLNGKYSFYRKELIPAFKEYRITDIHLFYNNLLFCRLLMDYYIITIEDGKNGNRYNILFLPGDEQSSSHDKDGAIQYQSMLYISQTPIYEWLKPLIIKLMEKRPCNYLELLSWIKDIDDAYRTLPDSVSSLSYDNDVDRYWFWRLDYYLWEQKEKYFDNTIDQEIVSDYVFRSNRSIEHLHPQHQEHNTEWKYEDVHAFGNLAMISQSFNSEQSDDPVTVKFARVLDQANSHNLQSIKLYRMYLDADKSPGGWTSEKMHKHQEEMLKILKDSFIR